MATNFPSSLDNFTNPVSGNTLDSPSHSLQHSDANDAIEAIEAKLGVGNSPAGSATSGYVLMAGSGGTTTWSALPAENQSFELLNVGGTTLTGASTITISGISNKKQILVRVDAASAANVSSLLSVIINGDTGGSSYSGSWLFREGTAMYNEQGGKSELYLGRMGSNSAGNNFSLHCLILGTNSTNPKPFVGTGFGDGTDSRGYNVTGIYTGSSVVSSIAVKSSSGNFDGGTLYVYGAS